MQLTLDCVPCLLTQMNKVMRVMGMDDDGARAAMRELLERLSRADLSVTPPDLSRVAWGVISRHAGTDNAYAEIKRAFNDDMLAFYPEIQAMIRDAGDPDLEAIKLAIVGNIVDFGAVHGIDRDGVLAAIDELERKPLAIDDRADLYAALAQAETLLYLGDNCGEIVFDKAFISYLRRRFPHLRIAYAVRGGPALNDVTRDDAEQVGMAQVAEVLDNGDNAPGTVLTAVSPEFRARFDGADVVIAKGQGNFESLNAVERGNVYLLFMAKCEVVATAANTERMSLVCMQAGSRDIRWSR
jgi:uncharacterized protein with ATP-grasp and redox domains